MMTMTVRVHLSRIGAAGVPKGRTDVQKGPKGITPWRATSRMTRAWPIATAIRLPKAERPTKTGRIWMDPTQRIDLEQEERRWLTLFPAYDPKTFSKKSAAVNTPEERTSSSGIAAKYW